MWTFNGGYSGAVLPPGRTTRPVRAFPGGMHDIRHWLANPRFRIHHETPVPFTGGQNISCLELSHHSFVARTSIKGGVRPIRRDGRTTVAPLAYSE